MIGCRTRLALVFAILLFGAAASAPATPEAVVAQARALAQQDKPEAALQVLETSLRRPSWKLAEADAASLHFLAAQMAVAASLPERAVPHLGKVRQLARAFVSAPELHARFLRQTAGLYQQIGLYGDSTALLETVIEQRAAKDPAMAAEAANALGTAWIELRRPDRAVAAFEKQLDLLRRAPADRKRLVTAYVNLTDAQLEAGDVAAARRAWEGARDAAAGDEGLRDAVDFAQAQILLREARLRQAEELLQSIADRPTLSDPGLRGHALLLLATARFNRGLLPEADEAAMAAAEAYRQSLGDWSPVLGRAFHTLGTIQDKLHNPAGAASFYARALEIQRRSFGERSVQFQTTDIEQAWIDVQNNRLDDAARRAAAALTVFHTASPPARRLEGIAQVLLGLIAEARGDDRAAVDRFRSGQRLILEERGPDSPDLGFSLIRLGRLLTQMNRYDEAAPPLDRAIALYERLGGAGGPYMADALAARAALRRVRGDRRGALEDSRRSFAVLRSRADSLGEMASGADEFQRNSARELFAAHARLLVDIAEDGNGATDSAGGKPQDKPGDKPADKDELLREAFVAGQESIISRAADALRRTAIRLASGSGDLARLLRDREDVADALRQTDALLRETLQRGGAAATREIARLSQLRDTQLSRVGERDAELARNFPQHSEFLHPTPRTLTDVQKQLAPDEAAIMTVVSSEALLTWTLTHDAAIVRSLPVDKEELGKLVDRVRAGVDLETVSRTKQLPSFDRDAAKRLYDLIIAPGQSVLEGKTHLIFIPDGRLQELPLHLLIGGEKDDWLVRRFAVTVFPSAGALVTQRETSYPSTATLSFLGIGDPDLAAFGGTSGPGLRGISVNLRDRLAALPALPETAVELRQMADLFPQGKAELVLGDDASKANFIRSHPERYRILAFSTHALMGGQLPGLTEPAIVLSPDGTSQPDGLLTASEIAAMKTDADLVILSACNTAARGGGPFEDGLSGLARAFLRAGARSLLVSHWSLASEQTIGLTTGFLARMRENANTGKAVALQQSILKMLDSGDPLFSHPAFWAPFVVVGD